MQIEITLKGVKLHLEIETDEYGDWQVEQVLNCENPLEFITAILTETNEFDSEIEKQLPSENDYFDGLAEIRGDFMREEM